MTLDAQTKALLDGMATAGSGGLHELPLEDARAALRQMSLQFAGPEIPIGRVESRSIGGPRGAILVRIYWPESAPASERLPIVMFHHGGGFALGDLDTHDNICRYLCANVRAIVVNVDYKRPPENKYPAAPEDCYAALQWAAAHACELGGDAARIAVAGDSAGGNLSAVVALMARDRKGPAIAFQALIYPSGDCDPGYSTPSREAFGGGEYFLSKADVDWIANMYFDDLGRASEPYASPLRAESLAGLPPALVIAAGFDILRDEDMTYAQRLAADGVDVEYKCYDGTIHGFVSFNAVIDAGKDALRLIADRLDRRLN